jgi:16S rRNA (cytosine967-C5)-methyltransferase
LQDKSVELRVPESFLFTSAVRAKSTRGREMPPRGPRGIALELLGSFRREKLDVRELLDRAASKARLSPEDSRLARELVLGVIRQRRLLDHQISRFLKDPKTRVRPALLNVLRIGFYQRYFMERIPSHALVDECVELSKGADSKRGSGFVNAILRNMLRQNLPLEQPDDPGIRFSHPDWLAGLMAARFGEGEGRRLMEWNNQRPDLHLRVNMLKSGVEDFCVSLEEPGAKISRAGSPAPECVIVEGSLGRIDRFEWFTEGLASAQDVASQLVAHFCQPTAGQRIIDWCAAPGGKAAHLAEMTGDRARILALDVDASRMRKIEENIARLGLSSIEARTLDPRLIDDLAKQPADLVLVDAPCTNLGTIRRNPDVRWRRRAGDPGKSARLQLEILQAASRAVRKGGWLVYSVCTFSREECEGVVEEFLERHRSFTLEKPDNAPDVLGPFIDDEGFLRTFPPDDGCDAFFAARFRRG